MGLSKLIFLATIMALNFSSLSLATFSTKCFEVQHATLSIYQTGPTHISTIVLFISLGPNISIAFKALNHPALNQLLATSHGEPMCEAAKSGHWGFAGQPEEPGGPHCHNAGARTSTNAIARHRGARRRLEPCSGRPSLALDLALQNRFLPILDLFAQDPMVQALHALWRTLEWKHQGSRIVGEKGLNPQIQQCPLFGPFVYHIWLVANQLG